MDTPLAGERVAEEKAFTKRYIESLAPRKVEYGADYSPPLESRPRKVPVLHTAVVPPPDVSGETSAQGGCPSSTLPHQLLSLILPPSLGCTPWACAVSPASR